MNRTQQALAVLRDAALAAMADLPAEDEAAKDSIQRTYSEVETALDYLDAALERD